MAISANGFAARKNGDEDFLPNEGWYECLELARSLGHLIWGRKTYETVIAWGENFVKDIEDIPILLVSRKGKASYPKNVIVCPTPESALQHVKNFGSRAFLAGGPTLNSIFVKAGYVDKIILNYNPTILASGINLFTESDFELELKLEDVKILSKDIVQLHYSVLKTVTDRSVL